MDVAEALNSAVVTIRNKANDSVGIKGDSVGLANPILESFFKLNPNDINHSASEKLSEIDSWIKTQAPDEIGQIKVLRDLRYRLGAPNLGSSEIEHFFKYIRLRKTADDMENRAKAMEYK